MATHALHFLLFSCFVFADVKGKVVVQPTHLQKTFTADHLQQVFEPYRQRLLT
jgi:hypothetical protein